MGIPNLLTILRILLIPFFINLLIYGYYSAGLGVFLFACLTDGLDGLVARASNQRTRLGLYLDPMADKLLLTAAFLTLSLLKILPGWIASIVVSRDAILILATVVLHLTQSQCDISPTAVGKATTVSQLMFVIFVLVLAVREDDPARALSTMMQQGVPLLLLIITLALTLLSGFHYLYRGIRSLNGRSPAQGQP